MSKGVRMHEHEHKHEHHCCPHKKKKLICLALGIFVAIVAIVAATCGIPCKEPAHVAVPDAGKVCAFPDAAEKRDGNRIRELVKLGADLNAAQADGMTALHWAVYHDDLANASVLVNAGARLGDGRACPEQHEQHGSEPNHP